MSIDNVPIHIVDGCIAGDATAWQTFVRCYAGYITSIVRNAFTIKNSHFSDEEVDDLVQDIFCKLIENSGNKLSTWDSTRSKLSTWLTVVCRNAVIDHLRKRSFRADIVTPLTEEHHTAEENTAQSDVIDTPLADFPLHILPERQQVIIRMNFALDMDVAEIADSLGIRQQTVRSLRHKALSTLRGEYGLKKAA